MKKVLALLVVALSSVTLHAQFQNIRTVWLFENIDPETGLRTGLISHRGTHNIQPGADLGDLDLRDADLARANLPSANLNQGDLDGVDLSGAFLRFADLSGASFVRANLRDANLQNTLLRASLREADLSGADLRGADLTVANLFGADLSDTELHATVLTGVRSGNISGTPRSLPRGYFLINGYLIGRAADLSNADLSGADLSDTDLTGANLSGVRSGNISGLPRVLPAGWLIFNGYLVGPDANLSGANLRGADLTGLDLTGANLTGADLRGANLSDTSLTNEQLGSLSTYLSGLNYDEIEFLKPHVETNTTEIDDLKVMMEAMSVQMQQLNTQLGDLQASVAEKDTQIAGLEAERDAAIQERDARYTEEQIRALSPDYTMGLNEAGNVEVKISFIASSDAENFAPFPVTADSLTVVDGKICMELPPDQGAFFYRFRIE